jgi:hypothetical protein
MKLINNKYGKEVRVGFGNTIFLINGGAIGVETTNEDLWNSGWRIGFTPVSFLLKKIGIYLFMATK